MDPIFLAGPPPPDTVVRVVESLDTKVNREVAEELAQKNYPWAKCSILEEDNITDMERATKCSTFKSCFNFAEFKKTGELKYDNKLCNGWESCTKFIDPADGKTKEGCIISKYCDVEALYRGNTVAYACPDGLKVDPKNDISQKDRIVDWNKHIDIEVAC